MSRERPKPDGEAIRRELYRQFHRAALNVDEMADQHGEDSALFLWAKCRFETLEMLLSFADPGGEWLKYVTPA